VPAGYTRGHDADRGGRTETRGWRDHRARWSRNPRREETGRTIIARSSSKSQLFRKQNSNAHAHARCARPKNRTRGPMFLARARTGSPFPLPSAPPPSERRRKLKRSRAVAGDRRSARNRIDVRNAHPDPRGARGEGVCTTMGAGGDESRESIHGSGRLLHPASVRWSNRRNISV
jgi:hypothetical protein